MLKYNCIFLDRDGTLNPDSGYISSVTNFKLFDFTISSLRQIAEIGNRFCIVTNQSGISRGLIQKEDLLEIHDFIAIKFQKNSIPLLGIYFCADHPDHPTSNRKPGSGMFQRAKHDHDLVLRDCLMVGDSADDIIAGKNLGMDTMLVLTGRGGEAIEELSRKYKPTFIAKDLMDGARILCQ